MIASWRHKGLRDLFLSGSSARVRADQQKKCLRLLDALEQAERSEDMNLPGLHFHGLQGKPKRFAVAVNGPWRITFGFKNGDAIDVDLEQYH
ncbi:MAG: type II toxin-antitoxin system RelE/ParE family toxin [Novosphingobium sp.]